MRMSAHSRGHCERKAERERAWKTHADMPQKALFDRRWEHQTGRGHASHPLATWGPGFGMALSTWLWATFVSHTQHLNRPTLKKIWLSLCVTNEWNKQTLDSEWVNSSQVMMGIPTTMCSTFWELTLVDSKHVHVRTISAQLVNRNPCTIVLHTIWTAQGNPPHTQVSNFLAEHSFPQTPMQSYVHVAPDLGTN